MTPLFFQPYLPKDFGSLADKAKAGMSPKLAKYLYITSLSRILASLDEPKQIEFISTLERSEESASAWLMDQTLISDLLKEHLERTLLSLRTAST